MKKRIGMLLLCALLGFAAAAGAETVSATDFKAWFGLFADALSGIQPVNEPQDTLDPARSGQALWQYEFGTVLAADAEGVGAEDILEISVETPQVTDCRGVRVGMAVSDAVPNLRTADSVTPLVVQEISPDVLSWVWAYVGEGGLYGVEFMAYEIDGEGAKEYALTYLVDMGEITGIRVRMTPSTAQAAAESSRTAVEIAQRQDGEALIYANSQSVLMAAELCVQGWARLGEDAAQLFSALGEPIEMQQLPNSVGRLLLYEGIVAELAFIERTGEELTAAVTVNTGDITGPRGLRCGMSVQEAAGLFRCEKNMLAQGGTLYMEGEAEDMPPCAMLIAGETGEMMLRYLCEMPDGRTGALEAWISDETVTGWRVCYDGASAADGQ